MTSGVSARVWALKRAGRKPRDFFHDHADGGKAIFAEQGRNHLKYPGADAGLLFMTRFVFLSFIFLGWAFYEVSGGNSFEPAPPERLTRLQDDAEQERRDRPGNDEESVDISAALAAESAPMPEPEPISIVTAPAPTPAQERVALIPAPEELAKLTVVEEDPADIREVRGNRVNMRSGPGTRYSVLETLTRNTRVEILREPGNGWAKLQVVETGRIGWMAASLLRKID